MVKVINSSSELKKEQEADNMPVTILDFYADWCGPCKRLTPVLVDLSNKYKDKVSVYKVNVDEAEDLCQFHNISCMPTVVFLVNNKVVDEMRIEGCNEVQLVNNIKLCLNMVNDSHKDNKVNEVNEVNEVDVVDKVDVLVDKLEVSGEDKLSEVNKEIKRLEEEINVLTSNDDQ